MMVPAITNATTRNRRCLFRRAGLPVQLPEGRPADARVAKADAAVLVLLVLSLLPL